MSVFTKTFANMLDSNGFVDQGKIIFSDESLADFTVKLGDAQNRKIRSIAAKLDEYARLESGAEIYKQMSYANAKNIPFVVLAGENEMAQGKVTLKNMETGEQTLVTAEELIAKVNK